MPLLDILISLTFNLSELKISMPLLPMLVSRGAVIHASISLLEATFVVTFFDLNVKMPPLVLTKRILLGSFTFKLHLLP